MIDSEVLLFKIYKLLEWKWKYDIEVEMKNKGNFFKLIGNWKELNGKIYQSMTELKVRQITSNFRNIL